MIPHVSLASLVPLMLCTIGGLIGPQTRQAPQAGATRQGIGVNYFDCFARHLADPANTTYEAGFAELEKRAIPFARFMCGGFWPVEMKLYQTDRAEYFRRLDDVVRSAERHHVGLIPSLFWYSATVPDLVREPRDAWGDPASKTRAFMQTYVREVVSRYKESPAIWGWEFGNEYNLDADLPNAADHRPAVHTELGTQASRSERDDLTHAIVRSALAAFGREVRRYDRKHLLVSGNAFPRPTAWHQMKELSWTKDTAEQRAEMLRGDNPDPIDTLSVHAYEDYGRIPEAMEVSRRAHKPLFVGEFGVPGPPTPENRKKFEEMLTLILRERVPLAALWVYDFGHQDEWGVTATNARSYQLDAIAAANARTKQGDGAASP